MMENSKNISNQDYEEISPTAMVTSYPRTFTDISYEKEIDHWLKKHIKKDTLLYQNMAPEMESRYKLINRILDKTHIKQVLELAAGYSSRGMIYSKKGYRYVELDLESIIKNKKEMLQDILKKIPENLKLMSGNPLRIDDFKKLESYFSNDHEIAVINEGLLRYLTFDEKRIVAKNIYQLLSKYGGIWITSDVTPKKFIKKQDEALTNFNKDVTKITSRNQLNDRFEDENHIRKFFGEIGFELVEIHKFSEIKDDLYSINVLGITNEKIEKSLDEAIVVMMKTRK